MERERDGYEFCWRDSDDDNKHNVKIMADVYRINNGGETLIVPEVLRIKNEIEANADKPLEVLLEPLRRLQLLVISCQTLKDTRIGFSVKPLMKHSSKRVRQIARFQTRRWRDRVDEWLMESQKEVKKDTSTSAAAAANKDEELTEKRKGAITIKIKLKGTSTSAAAAVVAKDEKLTEKTKGATTMVMKCASTSAAAVVAKDEKLEDKIKASNRKFNEGYKRIEDAKKRRKVQVLELKDLPCTEKLNKSPKAHWKKRNCKRF